jgi:alpha-ketoglutarate-dependent taurine dioxygenase
MYTRHFVEALDVGWQSFFHTEERAEVEEYCRRNSIQFEWADDGTLRTYQISPGVARHPRTGEEVFFNQVQLHHVSFLDTEVRRSIEALYRPEDYPRNVYYGDGTPIEDGVMQEILRVYNENSVSFRWQCGDILMVDNMLVAHARNPFKGDRRILVAMAEMMTISELEGRQQEQ